MTTPTSIHPHLQPQTSEQLAPTGRGTRLVSLDVLRGVTVAFMILVNNAGDGNASYAQLRHSVWNGCTLTDMVFPGFLFIMGVSMALAFQGRLAKGVTPGAIAGQVFQRSVVMFGLGLLLNALPAFQLGSLRYAGVLQRIALCYLICGLLMLFTRTWMVVVITACATIGYWIVLTRVSVPGFGLPGVDVPLLDPHGNLASYLDRLIIPSIHLYHKGFYDPEGLLSTLPALASVLLGSLSAIWIARKEIPASRRLASLAAASVALIFLGLVWGQSFPINKRLWTSSYVLFTAGIFMGLMAILIGAIDQRGWGKGSLWPWLVFGTNALTAYIFSELLSILIGSIHLRNGQTLQEMLYRMLPDALGPAPMRSLIWSILFVGVCFAPVWILYRRKIFLKL